MSIFTNEMSSTRVINSLLSAAEGNFTLVLRALRIKPPAEEMVETYRHGFLWLRKATRLNAKKRNLDAVIERIHILKESGHEHSCTRKES
jgi:hypothetical protein